MFTADNLASYIGLPATNCSVIPEFSNDPNEAMYRVAAIGSDPAHTAQTSMDHIIEQVDRDDEHPVVMNSVEVLSRVVKQPAPTDDPNELFIIVGIREVSHPVEDQAS